jgi:endonuclease-8
MPEGDTIFRAAQALHDALAGRTLTRLASTVPGVAAAAERLRLPGQTITAVEPRGKHLLMRFSNGPVLHTHLRMNGSWHLYRRGHPWPRPRAWARVILETPEVEAACFRAPVVELLSPGQAARHPALTRLGEDLLAAGFDPVRARAALRARSDAEIGAVLLDQTAVSGIGNVYKSEVLFLAGVNPFAEVAALPAATLDSLLAAAQVQMKRNLGPGRRRTTPERSRERLAVYGRRGRPCLRCATRIVARRQGDPPRLTYWCPRCQPASAPEA